MKSHDEGRDFKKKANAILEDRTKISLLVEILEGLDASKSSTLLPALHAISKVLVGLIRRNDVIFEKSKSTKDDVDPKTAVDKYTTFIWEIYQESWKKIMSLLCVDKDMQASKRIQELALNSGMQIVSAIHESKVDKKTATFWNGEAVKHYRMILRSLLSETVNNAEIISRFSDLYLGFIDVKQYTIQGLSKLIRKAQNTKLFQYNLMKILEGINFEIPNKNDDLSTFLCQSSFEYEHDPVKKAFSTLWEDFMKLGNKDFDLYKRILIIIHDKVMPYLTRPLLLTDFLMESYNVGGSVSLLALNGVFKLVQEHNLEYPEFYTKLYALLTLDVLHVKYRPRFFHLADLFLTSTLLPEYLVAAFVKRLSRLCLTAPANAILMVLPFIGNLLLRHRGLVGMINKVCDEADDPYDFQEPDPEKCRAVDSGLWEIRSLQSHLLPQVAQAAKFINKALPDKEWNISDYLEVSMDEMFHKETRKKIFVNVPLTFERPMGFKFAKQDISSEVFELS